MSDQTDTLISLLQPFGLTQAEARVYLVLLENGVLSALSISRKLNMGRTKVYRILDTLLAHGLISNQYDEVGFKFRAEPPEKFTLLVNTKKAEAELLAENLPQIQEALLLRMGSAETGSKVQYYKGQKGLSQVNWHLLEAQGEFVSFEVDTADIYLAQEEAEELRQELVRHQIKCRNIYNKVHLSPFTKVRELVRKWWQVRYINPEVFKIQTDVFIYNDVYAMCHYVGAGDVFCVEIYNEKLATMQKQLFELVWKQATPMRLIGENGEAIVDTY